MQSLIDSGKVNINQLSAVTNIPKDQLEGLKPDLIQALNAAYMVNKGKKGSGLALQQLTQGFLGKITGGV